ncbi:hypothetical protein GCM10010228_71420 [Streptomyces massasporeus]|nr:hypothetical protein GCM10010228_71420 [Streptomyces massasporeus]
MTQVQNEGNSDMLPAVSVPAFENMAAEGGKLCAHKGDWSTKSPTPQRVPMRLSARSQLRAPA